ncbi:MAG: hypothetical protein H5T73_03255 [Actinobacteria bacterium]|nr:hypothetical protein [Actinomycetota bacterium]
MKRYLEALYKVEVEQDGKTCILRSPLQGCAGQAFKACRVAMPPAAREPIQMPRPFSEGEKCPPAREFRKVTVQDELRFQKALTVITLTN